MQSVCGWAFSSVGRPWVAQRVWPRPMVPTRFAPQTAFSSSLILPDGPVDHHPALSSTASPAES